MLSDRITLAVAHYYMSGTEANYRFEQQAGVSEIKLSYTSNFKSVSTLLQFNDLRSLADFIENAFQIIVENGDFFNNGKIVPEKQSKILMDFDMIFS